MKPFTVVILGRPNVGKSSLLNALLGYRRAIVLDEAGTTRDEVAENVLWDGVNFRLIDSQGVFDENDFPVLQSLLEKADACVFVVDAITGPTPFDEWIARQVRVYKTSTLLCLNKSEVKKAHGEEDFAELGFSDLVTISAAHRSNLTYVREWCVRQAGPATVPAETIPEEKGEPVEELRIALVGRPNTGKSTLMNRLCGAAVSKVSPEPLTTRDPVSFEIAGVKGITRLVDTAGMRRPRSEKDQVEVFSIQASTRAIRDSQVVFLVLNSVEPIADQDMRLLSLLVREGKPAVVLLNFWDKMKGKSKKHFWDEAEFASLLENFPTLSVSGLTGFNVNKCLPLARRMARQASRRVSTSKLNKIVERLVHRNPPPTYGKQNFNILYSSQVRVEPPTFVFFMNRKAALPPHYKKYLENKLREELGLRGQPIRVFFRGQR